MSLRLRVTLIGEDFTLCEASTNSAFEMGPGVAISHGTLHLFWRRVEALLQEVSARAMLIVGKDLALRESTYKGHQKPFKQV